MFDNEYEENNLLQQAWTAVRYREVHCGCLFSGTPGSRYIAEIAMKDGYQLYSKEFSGPKMEPVDYEYFMDSTMSVADRMAKYSM